MKRESFPLRPPNENIKTLSWFAGPKHTDQTDTHTHTHTYKHTHCTLQKYVHIHTLPDTKHPAVADSNSSCVQTDVWTRQDGAEERRGTPAQVSKFKL